MLFKVQDREDIVDILSRVTPHQVAERMDPQWHWQAAPPPDGFDRMMQRACVAAVRLCGGPPILANGSGVGQIEWEAKRYLRKLVQRRDEFVERVNKRLGGAAHG